jgi:transposase
MQDIRRAAVAPAGAGWHSKDALDDAVTLRRSRLSRRQRSRLIEHFVAGTPARSAAQLVGVNRNTSKLFYHRLRELIAQRLARADPLERPAQAAAPALAGAPLFGIVSREGKVHTAMGSTLAQPDALVYEDARERRSVLAVSRLRFRRAESPERPSPEAGEVHNFWSQAERHLRRYNGIPRRHLHLFIKECEWRFNYGPPKRLLKLLKSWVESASQR